MTKTIYLFTVFVLLSASSLQGQTPFNMTIEELFRLADTQNSDIGAAGQAYIMKQKIRRRLQNMTVILLIAFGFAWIGYKFIGFTSSTYTDNAQVYQRLVPVNSRVQGFVKEVYFDDYVKVRKGDTLALVEDTDFRLRLAQARAHLQNALSGKDAAVTAASTSANDITVTDDTYVRTIRNHHGCHSRVFHFGAFEVAHENILLRLFCTRDVLPHCFLLSHSSVYGSLAVLPSAVCVRGSGGDDGDRCNLYSGAYYCLCPESSLWPDGLELPE